MMNFTQIHQITPPTKIYPFKKSYFKGTDILKICQNYRLTRQRLILSPQRNGNLKETRKITITTIKGSFWGLIPGELSHVQPLIHRTSSIL